MSEVKMARKQCFLATMFLGNIVFQAKSLGNWFIKFICPFLRNKLFLA